MATAQLLEVAARRGRQRGQRTDDNGDGGNGEKEPERGARGSGGNGNGGHREEQAGVLLIHARRQAVWGPVVEATAWRWRHGAGAGSRWEGEQVGEMGWAGEETP